MSLLRALNLDNLPAEIVLNIARSLQPRDTACLFLACKIFYNHHKGLEKLWKHGFDPNENHCGFKRQAWPPCPPLKMVNHEKYLFLQILARDLLKSQQLCDICVKFHPHLETVNTGERLVEAFCTSKQRVLSMTNKPPLVLCFDSVQRAMNLYRSGESHESALRSISSSRNWTVGEHGYFWSGSGRNTYITKLDVEPRIVCGNLMLHTRQHVFLTDAILGSLDQDRSSFAIGNYVAGLLSACPHYGCILQIVGGVEESIEKLESSYSEQSMGCSFGSVAACSCCLTDIALATYYHPGQGYEVVLKTWTNLGTCEWGYQAGWQLATLGGIYHYSTSHLRRAARRTKTTLGHPSEYDAQWVSEQHHLHRPSSSESKKSTPDTDPCIGPLAWIAMLLAWLWSLTVIIRRCPARQNLPRVTTPSLSPPLIFFQHNTSPIALDKLQIPMHARDSIPPFTLPRSPPVPASLPLLTMHDNPTSEDSPPYSLLQHITAPAVPVTPRIDTSAATSVDLAKNIKRRGWTNSFRESCKVWKNKANLGTESSKQEEVKGLNKKSGQSDSPSKLVERGEGVLRGFGQIVMSNP